MISKEIEDKLPEIRLCLAGQPVQRAWLFGSFSRGEATEGSDVDILVKYQEGSRVSLMTIGRIMVALSDVLKRPVDLVEEGRLLPFARESAEADKILIYEREN